jgi:hypothetical protein
LLLFGAQGIDKCVDRSFKFRQVIIDGGLQTV